MSDRHRILTPRGPDIVGLNGQALSRRRFVASGATLAALGSMAQVITSTSPAQARGRRGTFAGYGPLIADPNGILDLPRGFQYSMLSREGDPLTAGGRVPSLHDGMAAFPGFFATYLVRNHEIEPDDVAEEGAIAVPQLAGGTYDPEAPGGTTTLLVNWKRELVQHRVSLAGTLNNCAGGPTPWGTWLTCEEAVDDLGKPHGYVFEVDPRSGGNPDPIVAMGRFEHEAVSFDRRGIAYLTEDAGEPFGCFYRFVPKRRRGGRGSLHAGGKLTAMSVVGLTTDLSIVSAPGSKFKVRWVDVPNVNPTSSEASVREQAIGNGATPIPKCEGTWLGNEGDIWFVGSRGDGPDAEDEEDRSAGTHSGQIWRYDPRHDTIELVVMFTAPYDQPDNITVSPHGFALACTDGDDDQWLVSIDEQGGTFPFALNRLNEEEFAGATFSPFGDTLFVNLQGPPGITFAIWGPWHD
jgi:secreted PhoX family phosphatase